ncbi:hypothetical protein EV178_003090 [Coemansia sp. RSA 1646]|nr:hypothetical protein EV178_003090 [Coemansia sp. RSA 1646]KAJ2214929.1 hypothetical protein EV179_002604 [Coemansia sp. RSA 487]
MPTAEAFLGVLPFNLKNTSSPIPRRRNPNQGSSTFTSEVETQYLQQRSTELLLQNDFALAKLLCRLEISGDKAATMASHLVSFLRGNPKTVDQVDAFVLGAFDTHLRTYAQISPNPRNILRDNNLATMLVVCYLQQSCRSYLVSILQPVMTAISPFVHNCELDPNRLADDSDETTISRNAYNLYCVCRSVLDAVFSAGKHAPAEMRQLCTAIRSRIEASWELPSAVPQVPSKASRQGTPAPKQKEPEQPILELKDWEKDLKTTVQVDIMSDIKAALDEWLEHPYKDKTLASLSAKQRLNAPKAGASLYSMEAASLGAVSGSGSTSTNLIGGAQTTGDDAYCNEARQSLITMMSSTFSSPDKLEASLSLNKKKNPQAPIALRASEIKNTWRQTQSPRKTMSPTMSTRFSKHTSRRFSGSYFTPVETVISMLIFVRFFIPILTAPDAYGLDVKMSPANRRGLLLCAKVLAVLCNGVSFGTKETYLLPMNGLIKEYRPKLRHYLHAISSGAGTASMPGNDADSNSSSDDDGDDEGLSDGESNDDDLFTIDELASQFQVVSVGAKIATKEEQRKSRMSFTRHYMASLLPSTPDAQQAVVPPLPPLPQHPPAAPGKGESVVRMVRQASAEATLSVRRRAAGVQPSRTTIDIPAHASSSSAAVAVSSSAFDSLLDNEIVDESLVTIDFLTCLEGNFDKLETFVHGSPHSDPAVHQQMVDACRELKPIVHYAKRLSSPGRVPDTVSLSQGGAKTSHERQTNAKTSQEAPRRYPPPFGRQQSTSRRLSDEYEDLGRSRKSNMPEQSH